MKRQTLVTVDRLTLGPDGRWLLTELRNSIKENEVTAVTCNGCACEIDHGRELEAIIVAEGSAELE